ncbi:MAG: hypothetical protein E6J34_23785 [Chloroflexi bacterium]|nr:MAG: hypothetical protein E6J34_23785 [Chloroflexota bacterium]
MTSCGGPRLRGQAEQVTRSCISWQAREETRVKFPPLAMRLGICANPRTFLAHGGLAGGGSVVPDEREILRRSSPQRATHPMRSWLS